MIKNLEAVNNTTVLLLTVVLFTAAIFLLCYHYDNKYTADGSQPVGGILTLSEQDLERPIYLIRDWEIYRDKLLTPEDFHKLALLPDELVFIGQYSGFEGNASSGRSPHGSATYKLNIELPPNTRSYTLELPEIYSAYKLYIDGTLMAQMGDPTPQSYRPETGNGFVTIQAAGNMEILIAVSDYSHFYSGMVYPPAFGEPGAVTQLLNIRFMLRVAACASALCIGLLYFCVWLFTRKDTGNILPLLYSALCVCFVLYTCYPVIKTMMSGGMSLYAVENFAYCTMLLLVMAIQQRLTDTSEVWSRFFIAFGVFVCCWSLLLPWFLGDSLNLMMTYSGLLGIYSWVCAAFLTISAGFAVWREKVFSKPMLIGILVFDTSLVMDRLLPMFEPIRFGWFAELAGGFLVLLIGFVMAMEVAQQFRLRQAMENRVENTQRMMDIQRAYYPLILTKEEETRAARHDLRHHMTVIRTFMQNGESEKLTSYLDTYDEKLMPCLQASYCKHYVTNMILQMYSSLASQQATAFHVHADLPEAIMLDDVDMCVILGNLLENALEASLRIPTERRHISVHIGCELNRLGIFVDNSFDGVLHVKSGIFYSLKQKDRVGVGLSSVQALVKRYGGSADFYKGDDDRFHSEVLIHIRERVL